MNSVALLFLLAACSKPKPATPVPPPGTGGVDYGAEGGDLYGGEVYGGVVYGYTDGDDSAQYSPPRPPKHYATPALARAECEAYVVKVEKFMACDKLPPEAVEAAKQGLVAMKQAWADWDTWTADMQDQAADGCHQAVDAFTQAAQSMGCGI